MVWMMLGNALLIDKLRTPLPKAQNLSPLLICICILFSGINMVILHLPI
jgi:hypothetical protein